MMHINFLFWWATMTFAISRGDILGICLAGFGFMFIMVLIEEYEYVRDETTSKIRREGSLAVPSKRRSRSGEQRPLF
jgi:hypothetical protein